MDSRRRAQRSVRKLTAVGIRPTIHATGNGLPSHRTPASERLSSAGLDELLPSNVTSAYASATRRCTTEVNGRAGGRILDRTFDTTRWRLPRHRGEPHSVALAPSLPRSRRSDTHRAHTPSRSAHPDFGQTPEDRRVH